VDPKKHALAAVAVLALAALACRPSSRKSGPVSPSAEAANLVPFLPATLGAYTATDAATIEVDDAGPRIAATRRYTVGAKVARVTIATGDVQRWEGTLDSDEAHAFGSDSPTYWRTSAIAGHRTRIGEERPVTHSSECLVRISRNHVADVDVRLARAGECERLAALLDFAGIAATRGVPSPPSSRTR